MDSTAGIVLIVDIVIHIIWLNLIQMQFLFGLKASKTTTKKPLINGLLQQFSIILLLLGAIFWLGWMTVSKQ